MSTMQEKTYRPVLTETELRAISAALIAPARESYHAQLAKFTIDRMLLRINKRKLEYGSAPAAPVLPTGTLSTPSTTPSTATPIPTEETITDWIQYIKNQTENPSPETLEAEQLAKEGSLRNQGPLDLSDLE